MERHEISLTHKFIAAFLGAEVHHFALHVARERERSGDVGSAYRVFLQLAARYYGRPGGWRVLAARYVSASLKNGAEDRSNQKEEEERKKNIDDKITNHVG